VETRANTKKAAALTQVGMDMNNPPHLAEITGKDAEANRAR
jgi:hypothetical protein